MIAQLFSTQGDANLGGEVIGEPAATRPYRVTNRTVSEIEVIEFSTNVEFVRHAPPTKERCAFDVLGNDVLTTKKSDETDPSLVAGFDVERSEEGLAAVVVHRTRIQTVLEAHFEADLVGERVAELHTRRRTVAGVEPLIALRKVVR